MPEIIKITIAGKHEFEIKVVGANMETKPTPKVIQDQF